MAGVTFTETPMDNDLTAELEIGAFYWVYPAFDPDLDPDDALKSWMDDLQPARYCEDGSWLFIGSEMEWPVRRVGPKIAPPKLD